MKEKCVEEGLLSKNGEEYELTEKIIFLLNEALKIQNKLNEKGF